MYAPIFEYTKRRMRYPPVRLAVDQRRILLHAMIAEFGRHGVEVIVLAIAINHFHLLARFPELTCDTIRKYGRRLLNDGRGPAPRHLLGLARKHASEELAAASLKPESPVWAVRPKFDPVRDRRHQVNIARYGVGHLEEGAAVYYRGWDNPFSI